MLKSQDPKLVSKKTQKDKKESKAKKINVKPEKVLETKKENSNKNTKNCDMKLKKITSETCAEGKYCKSHEGEKSDIHKGNEHNSIKNTKTCEKKPDKSSLHHKDRAFTFDSTGIFGAREGDSTKTTMSNNDKPLPKEQKKLNEVVPKESCNEIQAGIGKTNDITKVSQLNFTLEASDSRLMNSQNETVIEGDTLRWNETKQMQPDLYDNYQDLPKRSKVYSINRNEYIKRNFVDGKVFYSCLLTLKSCEEEIIIRIHGKENLLTLNQDSFVARIIVNNHMLLNFRKPFPILKQNLLNAITIIKILEDNLTDLRNENYRQFKAILQNRINASIEHIDYAEDLLQLSNIYKMIKKGKINFQNQILEAIIKNKHISGVIKQVTQQFLTSENDLDHRNQLLPKFSDDIPVINNFPNFLYNVYNSGIINHKNNLKKMSPKYKRFFKLLDVDYLPDIILLSLTRNDIKLFLDLLMIVNHQSESLESIIPQEYIQNIWYDFYKKIISIPRCESVKEAGPLTNPIYFFLFKSFCEIMTEICSMSETPSKELLINEGGEINLAKKINFRKKTPMNEALQHQCRLIFKLMKHYQPGKYSNKIQFQYKFQSNYENKSFSEYLKNRLVYNTEGIKVDRFVWLCILDCGLSHLMPADQMNENIQKLIECLQKLFEKFLLKAEHDNHETFRIAAHNIIKLAAYICSYISTSSYQENELDQKILIQQTNLINSILETKNDENVKNHFANLVDVLKHYWKNRELIVGKILEKCSCTEFQDAVKENIIQRLHQIVHKSFYKSATVQQVIKFFRLYGEFLQHFNGVTFDWIVSEKSLPSTFSKAHLKLIDEEKKYYLVSNNQLFLNALKDRNANIPEHYVITVVMELLCIISNSLDKHIWSECDQLNAAGDLFLAIGHSLVHIKKQASYEDFDNFLRNCTFPFRDVLMNCVSYSDFKTRLNNVENFFLFTNKQKEIHIDTAINLCIESSRGVTSQNPIQKRILRDCYDRYSSKFSLLVISDIPSIIDDMRTNLENISPIEKWTPEFKQNIIPSLLANLAAVWTILESKDLVRVQKRIEPHVIQILCIFRLLGVDKESNGIDKHLAQVPTGQGKSVILCLLASLLALTGNKCMIACYSKYLAERDESAFREFFDILSEFDIRNKVHYSTIDNAVDQFLVHNINGTELGLRTLIKQLLLDELPDKITASDRKSNHSILLIDEVDVFFGENIYGNVYRACFVLAFPALLEIQLKIWEIVVDGTHENDIVCERIMEFINGILKDEKHEKFKDFIENCDDLFKTHLDVMIANAIDVSKVKLKRESYSIGFKLNSEGIIALRDKDGLYHTDRFILYYNIFYYFFLKETDFEDKDFSNYGYLVLSSGSISYSNLLNEFSVILGVSGTVTTLRRFEKEAIASYGINSMSVMPSFFGDRKLKFTPSSNCIFKGNNSEWLESIYYSVEDKVNKGRAIIVFFETEHEMNLFDEKYRGRIGRLQTLTGNEESSTMELYISESGVAQTVTLATRLMGRGVDYKANDLSVEKNGGVHIIQTFLSLKINEELQIRGRTARKDYQGSYELILCCQHLDTINCLKNADGKAVSSYSDLCALREKLSDSQGAIVKKKIEDATEKHNLTMAFLKSFADYTPSKRTDYLSRFATIEHET